MKSRHRYPILGIVSLRPPHESEEKVKFGWNLHSISVQYSQTQGQRLNLRDVELVRHSLDCFQWHSKPSIQVRLMAEDQKRI